MTDLTVHMVVMEERVAALTEGFKIPASIHSPAYMIISLSFQAVTQLELFGDMSTPPDITSPPVSMQCPLNPAA